MSPLPADPSPPAAAPSLSGFPDLPGGIRGDDPDVPQQYTPADAAAAASLLARSGDGRQVMSLSDEQIAALDGPDRRQFTASPWLDDHPEQRRVAAAVALRSLVAAEQIRPVLGGSTGQQVWEAAPEIAGCLVLRRTAPEFTTAERTVQTEQGPQVHHLHYYVHESGVLEEEVSPNGIHRFTVLEPAAASHRLATFLDPLGVGPGNGAGAPVRIRTSELPAHPLAEQLAGTRALSVVTRVRTAEGSVQQLHAYALPDAVLTMEALDPGTEDPELEFREVDQADLQALASVLVGRAG